MPSIFISHTHGDKAVADAIHGAIDGLFLNRVDVMYSTSKELDGGIAAGEDWLRWIETQVREARVSLILLTPSSIQKPWVLWEAGAVQGAALASAGEQVRRVLPIKFKLGADEVPTPFARAQVTDGLSRGDMELFFTQLVDDLSAELKGFRSVEAGRRIDGVLATYVEKVETALRFAPMTVTEAAVQEWLSRIDDLERAKRFSEVEQLNDWMNIAFGRQEDERRRPLDPRLHRKVGALYLSARRPGEAAQEFELARQLAPRDVYVLRNLGKAYLDQQRRKEAGEIIRAIETLDPQAFVRNAENAALKARWHREEGDLVGARDTLDRALERSADSYYLADLLAQVLLELKDKDRARATYERVLEIVARSREASVWSRASALTAAVALGDEARWLPLARELRQMNPSPDERASFERGLAKVAMSLGSEALLTRVRAVLDEGP